MEGVGTETKVYDLDPCSPPENPPQKATILPQGGAQGPPLGQAAGEPVCGSMSLIPLAPPEGFVTLELYEPSRGGRHFRLVPVGTAPPPADRRSCAAHSPHSSMDPLQSDESRGDKGIHGSRGSLYGSQGSLNDSCRAETDGEEKNCGFSV